MLLLLLFAFAIANGQTPTKQVVCEAGAIDLVFVVDQSGSVTGVHYKECLEACIQLTKSLNIGPDVSQSNVGFVLFDSAGSVAFMLTEFLSNDAVEREIRQLGYSRGGTNIADGMKVAISEVFRNPGAGRGSVPRVMVVVTDGQDDTNVAAEHQRALAANITTFALGVGAGVDVKELVAAAGDINHVFDVSDYSAVASVMDQICVEIEASVAPPGFVTGPRECPCTMLNLWLDIVLVLDSSNGVSRNDFTALQGLLTGFVMQVQISQQEGRYTRLAIVNTAKMAQRISSLTKYSSNTEAAADIFSLQFQGIDDFNIAAGLIEAQRILDESDKRPNARNLVILFASSGVDCKSTKASNFAQDDENPCRIAAHMVEDPNTELMTVALRFHEDTKFPTLDFGSPCYSAVNDLNLMSDLERLACRANCFCQHQYSQFRSDVDCRLYGECVYPKGVAAPYLSAQIGCKLDHMAIADVHNEEKGTFLKNIAVNDNQLPYWIGLMKKNGEYSWDNNGIALSRVDYTNWADNQPNQQAGDCVYARQSKGFRVQWFTAQCSWAAPNYYYFCQKNTCDTDNYCATI